MAKHVAIKCNYNNGDEVYMLDIMEFVLKILLNILLKVNEFGAVIRIVSVENIMIRDSKVRNQMVIVMKVIFSGNGNLGQAGSTKAKMLKCLNILEM